MSHSPSGAMHDVTLALPPSLRPDLAAIAGLIPADVKVLDLGCGDGELLEYLIKQKHVRGRGIELSEQGVLACVRRGISVRQGNLNEGLADYPDGSFDYVVLSQTLPFLTARGAFCSKCYGWDGARWSVSPTGATGAVVWNCCSPGACRSRRACPNLGMRHRAGRPLPSPTFRAFAA
ncbi:MAG: methionine biosynthesis protein MetW [Caldilineaceae bacterium]